MNNTHFLFLESFSFSFFFLFFFLTPPQISGNTLIMFEDIYICTTCGAPRVVWLFENWTLCFAVYHEPEWAWIHIQSTLFKHKITICYRNCTIPYLSPTWTDPRCTKKNNTVDCIITVFLSFSTDTLCCFSGTLHVTVLLLKKNYKWGKK